MSDGGRFTWVPFNREMFERFSEYSEDRRGLKDLIVHCIESIEGNVSYYGLEEMDPFSAASMMYTSTSMKSSDRNLEKRIKLSRSIRDVLSMECNLPVDFYGVPESVQSTVFADRSDGTSVGVLWDLFSAAKNLEGVSEAVKRFTGCFDKALKINGIAQTKMSIGLFWLRPDRFLNLDGPMRRFLKSKGYLFEGGAVPSEFDGETYLKICDDIRERIEGWGYSSFPELSDAAWRHSHSIKSRVGPELESDGAPYITEVQWTELLNDDSVFDDQGMTLIDGIMGLGGEASCNQLAKEYGGTWQHYKGQGTALARRVADRIGLSNPKDQGGDGWWSLLFDYREVNPEEPGKRVWIVRDELRKALETRPAVQRKRGYDRSSFLEEVFISGEEYDRLAEILEHNRNVIIQGPPGVGKTFMAKRLAYTLMGRADDSCIRTIQFHQSYGYEDFVIGFRPVSGGGFEVRRGVLPTFCAVAEGHPDQKHFLIIDEINRGNVSKVFGEALMLVEASHRGEKVGLMYDGEELAIPENLYIIGTMNTADRSLAMMDFALRRRFSFFDVEPNLDRVRAMRPEICGLLDAVSDINRAILDDGALGKGFLIGHSYFMSGSAESIVRHNLVPLLEEYWFDDRNKVRTWEDALKNAI